MRRKATIRLLVALLAVSAGACFSVANAQALPDWRHIGNAAIDLDLAGLATGPVARCWFLADGSRLRIQTAAGKVFETSDLETWHADPPTTTIPAVPAGQAARLPEPGAQVRNAPSQTSRVYAFGTYVYRSDDGGGHWANLTGVISGLVAQSLVGDSLQDLAVSPSNPDEIVVAGGDGVFRSVDGGLSWHGLNDGLPNLISARIRSLPLASQGTQVELKDGMVVEWQPGERQAWQPADNPQAVIDRALREGLSNELVWNTPVTALGRGGLYLYAGTKNGSIRGSSDGGSTWTQSYQVPGGGAVNAFWVDPNDGRTALAVLGSGEQRVVGTFNGGQFWQDISNNLPAGAVHGVSADRPSNVVYVATDLGVFWSRTNLNGMVGAPWTAMAGLQPGAVDDVRLDAAAVNVWVAVDGYGVFQAVAPHRIGDPRVVSSADLVARAAAPGASFTVIGARVQTARAGDLAFPVLAANDTQSQIQIPFEARGSTLALAINDGAQQRAFSLALNPTAP